MRNRNYFFQPKTQASMPLASGGTMSFYEPDSLLSDQISDKKALSMEIAIRETQWN